MSKRESAYCKVREAIVYGQLAPGERLVEKRLCEEFRIGRTPLREALSQLQIEGYLESTHNRGLTISKMSTQNAKEIYDIIAAMEGYSAKIATKYIDEAQLKNLRSIQGALRSAASSNNQQKWMEKNAMFHSSLVKYSRNNFLNILIESLRNRIYRYRLIAMVIPGSLERYYIAHERILEAISKKDAMGAGRSMQNHVLDVGKNLMSFMHKIPGL